MHLPPTVWARPSIPPRPTRSGFIAWDFRNEVIERNREALYCTFLLLCLVSPLIVCFKLDRLGRS